MTLVPLASVGVCFLPITDVVPEEELPIVDKLVVQYALEETVYTSIITLFLLTVTSARLTIMLVRMMSLKPLYAVKQRCVG